MAGVNKKEPDKNSAAWRLAQLNGAQNAGGANDLSIAQQRQNTREKLVSGSLDGSMSGYEAWKEAYSRRAAQAGQQAAEAARQGAGGWGTSYAAGVGQAVKENVNERAAESWYGNAKAAYEKRLAAQQEQAAVPEDRSKSLYGSIVSGDMYDGSNENALKSQLLNLGYTEDEVETAMRMVKSDFAAGVKDVAAAGYGNKATYEQWRDAGAISDADVAAAVTRESENLKGALGKAMADPQNAAGHIAMSEEEQAAYEGLEDDDARVGYLNDLAGRAVMDGQMQPTQFAALIMPQVEEAVREAKESKYKYRDMASIASLLMEYKNRGYFGDTANDKNFGVYTRMMQELGEEFIAMNEITEGRSWIEANVVGGKEGDGLDPYINKPLGWSDKNMEGFREMMRYQTTMPRLRRLAK